MNQTIQEESCLRRDVGFLEILCTRLQQFDRGEEIEESILEGWNLHVGDCLEYECGCNISGIAKVVRIGEPSESTPGEITCAFIKLS